MHGKSTRHLDAPRPHCHTCRHLQVSGREDKVAVDGHVTREDGQSSVDLDATGSYDETHIIHSHTTRNVEAIVVDAQASTDEKTSSIHFEPTLSHFESSARDGDAFRYSESSVQDGEVVYHEIAVHGKVAV